MMSKANRPEINILLNQAIESEGFFDTFYTILFKESPRAKEAFSEVDMSGQKEKLKRSMPRFLQIVTSEGDSTEGGRARHAQHHSHLRSADYGLWLDVLCRTFAHHTPNFNTELEQEIRARAQASLKRLRAKE